MTDLGKPRTNGPSGVDAVIASHLAGVLPCVRCTYDLRGLTIRGVCPECGTPVRVTLLAKVDPHAHELQPITHPRLVAWGVVAWGLGAALAAWVTWWTRFTFLHGVDRVQQARTLASIIVALVAISGLGAMALVRPHRGITKARACTAALGVVLYAPLCWALWRLHAQLDPMLGRVYGVGANPAIERHMLRVGTLAIIVGIMLLLRTNARSLYVRSLLMRRGLSDRQTLAAMIAVVGFIALGDAAAIAVSERSGALADAGRMASQIGIFVGSVLLTAGLVGVAVDVLRLRSVILQPALSLESVIGAPRRPGVIAPEYEP